LPTARPPHDDAVLAAVKARPGGGDA